MLLWKFADMTFKPLWTIVARFTLVQCQTLHVIRTALLCKSHALSARCRLSHTDCMAEFASIQTKVMQDSFFSLHQNQIAWVFTPMRSDSCPNWQFALQYVNQSRGVINFVLTLSVWTACKSGAMLEPAVDSQGSRITSMWIEPSLWCFISTHNRSLVGAFSLFNRLGQWEEHMWHREWTWHH